MAKKIEPTTRDGRLLKATLNDPAGVDAVRVARSQQFCIAAFDPCSSSGACGFCFLADAGPIAAEDLPVVAGRVHSATLAARLKQMRRDVAVIVRVAAMARQGVSSTFKFGTAYGILQGVVAALEIPVHFVAPSRRKKYLGLGAEKEKSRARPLQLWPGRSDLFGRVEDHGRTESAPWRATSRRLKRRDHERRRP
jgi:crossover junction endodeoxyribonuclease RuvC